jgi:hypothetical protein
MTDHNREHAMDFVNLEMMTAMIVQHEELSAKLKGGDWKWIMRYRKLHADNYRCLRAAIIRFIDQAQQLRRDNGASGYVGYIKLAQALVKRHWAESLLLLESMGVVHLDGDEPTES